MNLQKVFYSGSNQLRTGWRMLIFFGLLLTGISPLILIKNSFIQFFFAVIILILALNLSARHLDKVPFSAYGLKFNTINIILFLFGLGIGAFSVTGIFYIGKWSNFISAKIQSTNPDYWNLSLFGFKMICVAIIEETIFRGYIFTNILASIRSHVSNHNAPLIIAVFISSLLFGLAHLGNENASLISISNLTINGVVWCIPFVLTKKLGLSIGLHSSWNFTQTLLGFNMSGNEAVNSIYLIRNIGNQFWTGGNYGPEAGILGIIGFLTMLIISLILIKSMGLMGDNKQ